MARRTLTVVAGVLLCGGPAFGGGAGAASASAAGVSGYGGVSGLAALAGLSVRPALAGPPVATSPASPMTASVTGTPVNGVQLSMVTPQQLPLSLMTSAPQPTPRELDITIKDVGGAGYTGTVATTFSEESATAVPGFTVLLQRFDPGTNTWSDLHSAVGTKTTFQDDAPVAVPAGGQVVERYRADPGLSRFDDLKIVAAANGANVTAVVPVTVPKFEVTGLPGSFHAGVAYTLSGKLTNVTDTDYSGIDVEFSLGACDPTAGKCFLAKDSKLEIQVAGIWKAVPLQDHQQWNGFSGFPVKDAKLVHGAVLSIPLRVTLPVNNLQVGAMTAMFQPNIVGGLGDLHATLIAAPVPSAATRSSQPSSPSASQASTSASSTPTDPPAATPSDTGTPTPGPSSGPLTAVPAAAPTPSSGSNATVLLAVGLLVLCGGLVGGYFYLKRRGRV